MTIEITIIAAWLPVYGVLMGLLIGPKREKDNGIVGHLVPCEDLR